MRCIALHIRNLSQRCMERHLPHGIAQCYLSPDTGERALTPEGSKAELTRVQFATDCTTSHHCFKRIINLANVSSKMKWRRLIHQNGGRVPLQGYRRYKSFSNV